MIQDGDAAMQKSTRILIGATLIAGSLTLAPVVASEASASIPGCADKDYSCGYLHGFADGRTAKNLGLCAQRHRHAPREDVASERGYREAFQRYCPA
jgi:hypothetical protein